MIMGILEEPSAVADNATALLNCSRYYHDE